MLFHLTVMSVISDSTEMNLFNSNMLLMFNKLHPFPHFYELKFVCPSDRVTSVQLVKAKKNFWKKSNPYNNCSILPISNHSV